MSTLAGSGEVGFADTGPGTSAQFRDPFGVAVGSSGNVYVADSGNHCIRKVTADGEVSILAGSGTKGWGWGDGFGSEAQFHSPTGVAVDSSGNVYVADYDNHLIRKVVTAKNGTVTVSTLAGSGTEGFKDGPVNEAQFNSPTGVAVDSSGNVYVADTWNHRIRKVTANGTVSTLAGSGARGHADTGTDTSARFNEPSGVAVDSSGNVYVADRSNHRIRKIVTAGGEVSTLAGSGTEGFLDGAGSSAQFNNPEGVAVDSSGNVYVADRSNHRIRKIVTAGGEVSTLAGSGTEGFLNYADTPARFRLPSGVAVDSSGIVYVADTWSNRIRKVVTAKDGTVTVSTLAGSVEEGFLNGAGSSAQFNEPYGVAVDSSGIVYVADSHNHFIRKIEYR